MVRSILMRDDGHHQKIVICSWFVGVEKRAVLAEVVTSFGDPRIMDKRRCLQVMRKLLYLLNQGQTFTKTEAAAILFSAVKLFRLNDLHLRRLVYLIAAELCPIAEEVVMLESALLLDLGCISTLLPNAVRLLCRITNVPSSINVMETLGSAIMSPVFKVSSAGLVCALHLLKKNQNPRIGIYLCELVGTVADIFYGIWKFHALCLLSRMQEIKTLGLRELARSHIEKIISYQLQDNGVNNGHPLFACLVIRLITQINRASGGSGQAYEDYCKYIMRCLGVWGFMHKLGNEMVAIEGLYSVMQLRNVCGGSVKATIEEVGRRLPSHEIALIQHPFEIQPPYISHDQKPKPVFLNVRRSMLKWSRIQNHLLPEWSRIQNHLLPDDDDDDDLLPDDDDDDDLLPDDDDDDDLQPDDYDDAQLAISKIQGPAPAINSLNLRNGRIVLQY